MTGQSKPQRGRGMTVRVKSQQDLSRDWQQLRANRCIQKIVKALQAKPDQAQDVLDAIENDFFSRADLTVKVEDRDFWPSSYHVFSQIGKYWLVAWLVQHGGKGFTEELAWKIDGQAPDALRCLVEFATGVKASAKLPRACLDKSVLAATLAALHVTLGKRLLALMAAGAIDKATGQINYVKCGAYVYVLDGSGKVTHLQNRAGVQVPVPDDATIRPEWPIDNNFSDQDAGIFRGMFACTFSTQFDPFKLSAEVFGNEAFKKLADQHKATKEQQELEHEAASPKVDAKGAVQKKPKKAAPKPPAKASVRKITVKRR
ncbi:unnamed protein product [Prorocentrum cordatum]|uniref:Uncharacterized protein n=1 Tax=Prorocentrum cordatum TaxID=2364126 RepID=A0ABN9WVD4_9DINO|nr:unnamed protein product [Polarella glacialis]